MSQLWFLRAVFRKKNEKDNIANDNFNQRQHTRSGRRGGEQACLQRSARQFLPR